MHRFASLVLALAFLVSLLPVAAAEFGPESEDGWPVNVHGEPIVPPVDPAGHYASIVHDPHRHGHIDEAALPALNKLGPVTLFPYYPILTAEVQRLALDHPDKVKLSSAGKSQAGLDLWLLEIANFDDPEMIPLEDREVIYLDGGTHSNEYSGVYFTLEIAQFLLDEYDTNETAKWVVDNRHVWILPMVNPDGSNVFGRLNANLVNVNRNFPGTYGTVDESPLMNNPGPEPASEPETQVVIGIMDEIQPDYVNSIHCCGNLWLHPFGAEQLGDPDDIEMYTRICDEVFADVRSDCGPIWSTIYPASGTTADEGYMRVGASSWSYEMSGRGAVAPWGQPAIMDDVRVQERESWAGVMHALRYGHLYGAWPEVVSVSGDGTALQVTIENVGWGVLPEGMLSVAGHDVALPRIEPGAAAEVTVSGEFGAGEAPLQLQWTKRLYLAPQGERAHTLTLVRDAAGGLLGALDDGPLPESVAEPAIEESPVGWVPLALLGALVAALGVARRRRG